MENCRTFIAALAARAERLLLLLNIKINSLKFQQISRDPKKKNQTEVLALKKENERENKEIKKTREIISHFLR